MKSEEFRIWIQGYLELSSEKYLNAKQIRIISNHAKLVKIIYKKEDKLIDKFVSLLYENITQENVIAIASDLLFKE